MDFLKADSQESQIDPSATFMELDCRLSSSLSPRPEQEPRNRSGGGASLVNNHFASAEMLCPCGANP